MPLDPAAALDALALIVDAVSDSAKLRRWFCGLAGMSEDMRGQAITRATRQMQTHGATSELVAAFGLLAHPPLFAAVLTTLQERGVHV